MAVALLATLLLRASIPDGYMPSPAGGGLLFELCPTAVPAEFMQALAGHGSHHQHHGAPDDAPATHFDAAQCPIGHLLSAAVAADMPWPEPDEPARAELPVLPVAALASGHRIARRSRGPPA